MEYTPIGTISLSHQDLVKKTARTGYWISNRYWGKGYTSSAFSQILDLARDKGIKRVSASIEADNPASVRIWEKYRAEIELKAGRYNVSLEL